MLAMLGIIAGALVTTGSLLMSHDGRPEAPTPPPTPPAVLPPDDLGVLRIAQVGWPSLFAAVSSHLGSGRLQALSPRTPPSSPLLEPRSVGSVPDTPEGLDSSKVRLQTVDGAPAGLTSSLLEDEEDALGSAFYTPGLNVPHSDHGSEGELQEDGEIVMSPRAMQDSVSHGWSPSGGRVTGEVEERELICRCLTPRLTKPL